VKHPLMLLPTDATMGSDVRFKKILKAYSDDVASFDHDFAAAFGKLMSFGTTTSQQGNLFVLCLCLLTVAFTECSLAFGKHTCGTCLSDVTSACAWAQDDNRTTFRVPAADCATSGVDCIHKADMCVGDYEALSLDVAALLPDRVWDFTGLWLFLFCCHTTETRLWHLGTSVRAACVACVGHV
jgi:hypothetical protein